MSTSVSAAVDQAPVVCGHSSPSHGNSALKINVYPSLNELPGSFQRMFERWGNRSVFYSLPWFRNFVANGVDPNDQIRLYCVTQDDGAEAPVGLLPVHFSTSPPGVLGMRRLSGLASYYTSLFGPMVDDSRADTPTILAALARAMAEETPRWDV